VVAAFARQVARVAAGLQEKTLRVGALEPRRDFLDVRDICAAYVAALAAPAIEPGTILNIASGTARRIGDILDMLCLLAGIAPDIETAHALLRPGEIATAAGDAARARALLGWRPAIPWEQTLADTLAYWRARLAADPAA
jgi:GDP-4-dehydro-6-deoxy-D-mannose reductase